MDGEPVGHRRVESGRVGPGLPRQEALPALLVALDISAMIANSISRKFEQGKKSCLNFKCASVCRYSIVQ